MQVSQAVGAAQMCTNGEFLHRAEHDQRIHTLYSFEREKISTNQPHGFHSRSQLHPISLQFIPGSRIHRLHAKIQLIYFCTICALLSAGSTTGPTTTS